MFVIKVTTKIVQACSLLEFRRFYIIFKSSLSQKQVTIASVTEICIKLYHVLVCFDGSEQTLSYINDIVQSVIIMKYIKCNCT